MHEILNGLNRRGDARLLRALELDEPQPPHEPPQHSTGRLPHIITLPARCRPMRWARRQRAVRHAAMAHTAHNRRE